MRHETVIQSKTFLMYDINLQIMTSIISCELTLWLIPADDPLHPMTLEDAGYSGKPRAGEAVSGVEGEHQHGVRTNNIDGQFSYAIPQHLFLSLQLKTWCTRNHEICWCQDITILKAKHWGNIITSLLCKLSFSKHLNSCQQKVQKQTKIYHHELPSSDLTNSILE